MLIFLSFNLGEALGAIGSTDVTEILKKYSVDPNIEVAETCQIALDRVNWLNNNGPTKKDENPYASVDPSPPSDLKNVDELKALLLNNDSKLFDRYRAMFSLRNLRTEESVLALSAGLFSGSNLFRHEVAFVLGQLQEPCSVPFLIKSLQNENENEMVRHECAEALGSIATEECIDVLQNYLKDNKQVVRESCEIALDMCEYENSPEFQYANCLQNNTD